MKNIVRIFLAIVILGIAIITGIALVNYYGKLEIPELKSQNMAYGSVTDIKESDDNYEIQVKEFNSDSQVINTSIKEFVDAKVKSFKEENKVSKKIRDKDRAVLLQVIDTYSVNEDVVGIKITSKEKKVYAEDYTTSIDTFNYHLKTEKTVTLEDIFKDNYKEKITDVYTDKYLLNDKNIIFYKDNEETVTTYNYLKEYTNSKVLKASNLDITEEEYNKLTEEVIDKTKKMVAITFDDGPHKTNTQEILGILSKYNAKATFFMLGQNVSAYPSIVKSVHDSGHEIGIHTWSHPELTKLSQAQIASEIENTANSIKDVTGTKPWLVRPPYGSINSTVKEAVANPFILWNIDSLDWKSRDKNQIVPLVVNDVEDGDIILLHDIHSTTVPAVEEIVKYLVENDYQIITVSQMLEAKGYDTSQTRVFYSARQ